MPLSYIGVWEYVPSPCVPMHAMRLSVHLAVYSTVYCKYTLYTIMIITDDNNNENFKIGELITQESCAAQNGHISLHVNVKTPFHLLSPY